MLKKLNKCLIFVNIRSNDKSSYFDENQASHPTQRVDCVSPQKPDKFKQIFSNLLHRNNGVYTYTYRTTQLHPDERGYGRSSAELAKAAEGNKSAAVHARKATHGLEKLGKEFRKQSIAELK